MTLTTLERVLYGASLLALATGSVMADPPEMKMTTDIPSSIRAPGGVVTSIGTMKFFDGVPDAASVETSYDFLDRSRADKVFINLIPMMSAYMLREGQVSMGLDAGHKIRIWDDLKVYPLSAMDSLSETEFVNLSCKVMNTIVPNEYSFFEQLHELIQGELDEFLGPEAKGMMAAIGITKGQPFAPDDRMKKILSDVAARGNPGVREIS